MTFFSKLKLEHENVSSCNEINKCLKVNRDVKTTTSAKAKNLNLCFRANKLP